MSSEKGRFSAEISDTVIAEALKSVQARSSGKPEAAQAPANGEVEVPVEAEGSAPPPAADPAPAEASGASADKPVDGSARETSLRLQLEFSQAKGRELMEKLKEEHERTLRAVADLENLRKRVQKEKEELQRFGQEKLLKDLLPVADNLDRALDHAAKAADPDGLKKGVEMIRKLFEDTLGKHGLKAFSAVGRPFDPRLHEAMNQVETADAPPNSVVMEMVRGFTLHDRLLRPALVSVAKAPGGQNAPASPPSGGPPDGAGGPG